MNGFTFVVLAVSQECLFVGLALRPVSTREPMCSRGVAVLEELVSAECYSILRGRHGRGNYGWILPTYFKEAAVDAFCRGPTHSPRLGGLLLVNPFL